MSKKSHAAISILFVFIFISVSVAAGPEYKEGELLVRFAPKENKHQRTKTEKETILSSINGGTIKHSHEKLVPGLNVIVLAVLFLILKSPQSYTNSRLLWEKRRFLLFWKIS